MAPACAPTRPWWGQRARCRRDPAEVREALAAWAAGRSGRSPPWSTPARGCRAKSAFAWMGGTERARDHRTEVMWRDPETRTEAERVDAITKLASVGVPQEPCGPASPGSRHR